MLTTNQQLRNPSQIERRILTSLAAGDSRQDAALHAGLTVRAVTAILEKMRDRFAPTMPALIALAVKLEWIPVPIWTMPAQPPTPLPPTAPASRSKRYLHPGATCQHQFKREKASHVRALPPRNHPWN